MHIACSLGTLASGDDVRPPAQRVAEVLPHSTAWINSV